MRNLLIIGLLIAVGWYLATDSQPGGFNQRPPLAAATADPQFLTFQAEDLYRQRRPFADLAEPGVYTLIEVYSSNCAICRRLDKGYPAFHKARPDVAHRRVEVFSGRIEFGSKTDMQRWKQTQDGIMDFYGLQGTPHIVIYDPAGNTLAADKRQKAGLAFLERWMAAE